ncbi:unnamed protein product [Coffea canephora]|uniref:JmjC domain-containing protein n=1 Tax=Coffea canephora TaxID=49390 RepID=A0A068UJ40_COFCA|nr:unnamed protein product [Coffea canephora]
MFWAEVKLLQRSGAKVQILVSSLVFTKNEPKVAKWPKNSLVIYFFRNEYGDLSQDCDDHIPWASEALGCLPEAVNLWIGNQLSVTSFHKDHYENLYAVITGEKRFLLLPPTDVHRMYIRDYPAAQYRYSEDTEDFELEIEDPVRYVPWCSVDPYPSFEGINRQMAEFPLYYNGPKPFEVTVKAGQVLYL